MTSGLDMLAATAKAQIALYAYPDKDWVTPRIAPDGTTARDVVIIGGGQSGLAIAFGLRRARISNILVLDENKPGLEGPWVTYGRMITLRTLKFLTGPDLGVPALTYRAFHEARFGPQSWADLVRIPRHDWMHYLVWLRTTLALPVRNDTHVDEIACVDGFVRLRLAGGETIWTRKLVAATGLSGAGGLQVPEMIRHFLPRARWAHSAEPVDFAALAGKRVAVIGAGASAYDNAATALEAGAARVDLFVRRDTLTVTTTLRHVENAGFFRHYADMADADRWLFTRRMLAGTVPPPQDTVERAERHAAFRQHFGAPVHAAAMAGGEIRLETGRGTFHTDFVITGTGFAVDLRRRPEYAPIASHAALWGDRYTPPDDEQDAALALYPYTGPAYELTPRGPEAPANIADIHLYNAGSLLSNGPTAGGLNGMPFGMPRLLDGLTRSLYLAETDRLYAGLATYGEADPWASISTPVEAESLPVA